MKNIALKPIVFLFVALIMSALTFAQNNPYGSGYGDDNNNRNSSRRFTRRCTEPFPARSFNRDFGGLSNTNYYHIDKAVRDYTKSRCLASEQIRRLALLLPTDREKYDYLTFSLNYVFDIENYSLAGTVLANRNARDGFYRFLVREGVPAGDYYIDPLYANGGGYAYNGTVIMTPPPPQYADRYGNTYYNNNGYNNNQPQNYGGSFGNPDVNRSDNRPNNTNNNYPQSQFGNNSGYRGMMTYQEFDLLKEKIRQNTLEKRKLDVAKSLTRDNVLTVNQIAEITRMFSFDNSRLDYAKFAYDFAFDRENYLALTELMTFEGNKKELQRYIENVNKRR